MQCTEEVKYGSIAGRVKIVRECMNLNIVEISALTGYSQTFFPSMEENYEPQYPLTRLSLDFAKRLV